MTTVIAPRNERQTPAPAQRGDIPAAASQYVPPHQPHRTTKRRLLFSGAVVAIVMIGTAWWARRAGAPIRYVATPVTRGSVERTVTASGTINPVLDVEVGTYVSGVITHLYCDYNTVVKEGQICAKIDPRPYQTIVDQEQATLANAKAQLAKDSANFVYAQLAYERGVKLQQQDYISQDTLDQKRNVYDQARAQMDLDRAAISQHEAALSAAQVSLGYTDIVSPVNGTVISRNVTVGQTVAASFQTPTLFIIGTNLTQMQVDANVSESDIGGLKVGNTASFTVEAYPDRAFNGSVVQVRQAPQSVQNVVTYDVVIGVGNQDGALMPGMTATCRITTARRDGVVRVPNVALRYAPGGLAVTLRHASADSGQVWVLRHGQPMPVPVRLGLADDTYTEIARGEVETGDSVVVSEGPASGGQAAPRLPHM